MNVKGSAIISTLEYIKDKYGDAILEKIKAKLSQEERDIVEGAIVQPTWYPFSIYINLTKYMDMICGVGDLTLAKEIGRWAADHDLKTIYRVFYMLGSPQFIIKKASSVFATYFDEGSFNVVSEGKGQVTVELVDFPVEADLVFIQRITGFMEKTLELSGGKEPKAWGIVREEEGKRKIIFNAFWK